MPKRSGPLDENSAVNSVAARLAAYVALAGAAAAGVALALRRHNRRAAADAEPVGEEVNEAPPAAVGLVSEFHLAEPGNGASVKHLPGPVATGTSGKHPAEPVATGTEAGAAAIVAEPGRAGIA